MNRHERRLYARVNRTQMLPGDASTTIVRDPGMTRKDWRAAMAQAQYEHDLPARRMVLSAMLTKLAKLRKED